MEPFEPEPPEPPEPVGVSPAERPGEGPDWRPVATPPPRANGSVLMAAMIGLANALGMEQHRQPLEAVQPAEPKDDDFDLDWNGLRPLDD